MILIKKKKNEYSLRTLVKGTAGRNSLKLWKVRKNVIGTYTRIFVGSGYRDSRQQVDKQ
jgi:hypothetical protein